MKENRSRFSLAKLQETSDVDCVERGHGVMDTKSSTKAMCCRARNKSVPQKLHYFRFGWSLLSMNVKQ